MYLEEKAAFTLAAIGVVLASTSGVGVIASTLAHRVPARSPDAIAVVFALANGLLLASVAVDGLLAVALLVGSAGVNGSAAVLLAAHLQRSIRDLHGRPSLPSSAWVRSWAVCFSIWLSVS